LSSSYESRNQGYDEKDDEDPKQQPSSLHGKASHAAKSDGRRDKRDDQEYQRIVKQITHEQLHRIRSHRWSAARCINAVRAMAVPGQAGATRKPCTVVRRGMDAVHEGNAGIG